MLIQFFTNNCLRLKTMLDNHFVECEKLKTFYDQKVLDERKANSEVRLKVQSFNQFDSSQSQASKEDANIIFEMILNEETNLLNVKLVQLEKCVEEKLKFENDLEEECELELLTLISDLNYKSLPVLYAIVAHKEEIKILRAEFQVSQTKKYCLLITHFCCFFFFDDLKSHYASRSTTMQAETEKRNEYCQRLK